MNVTVHCRCRNADRAEQRIHGIGEQAGQLVAQHLGGRLPSVDVMLTDRGGMAKLIQQADIGLAGGSTWRRRAIGRVIDHWHARHAFAVTTLSPTGALVVIDATRHRDLRELDRTLLHEFAHAVQLTQPGARDRHITYLRQQYGAIEHNKAYQQTYERLMDVREQQAENLEALAPRLPKGH